MYSFEVQVFFLNYQGNHDLWSLDHPSDGPCFAATWPPSWCRECTGISRKDSILYLFYPLEFGIFMDKI